MSHVPMKTILEKARAHRYGVPNLWGGSVEQVLGAVAAAEAKRAPLILCYNRGLCPSLPMEIGVPMLVAAAERASVPIATNLDHGEDLDSVLRAIHCGASSVMFDGSSLPYEENVSQTKEVVRVAHALKVTVEGELGSVGGSATEISSYGEASGVMTDPTTVPDFVERTGVDALAVSFGNMHGPYRGDVHLDMQRLRQISTLSAVPLVMHGASGLDRSVYPELIASGISKVNFYTSIARGAASNVKEHLLQGSREVAEHNIMAWNIEYYTEQFGLLLDLLGATGAGGDALASPDNASLRRVVVEEISKAIIEQMEQRLSSGIGTSALEGRGWS